MSGSFVRKLGAGLAVALVIAFAAPAVTAAKVGGTRPQGVRPQYVYSKDVYEPDDTTATAKVLPELSYHTFDTGKDVDWFKFAVDETGTPFVIENQFMVKPPYTTGYWDTMMSIYRLDPATGGLADVMTNIDDSSVFLSYGPTVYFEAPAPGTYFVKEWPNSSAEFGPYTTYIRKGIARRIGGVNRFETAALVSQRMYSDCANTAWGSGAGPAAVILTNGAAFADALAAGPWGCSAGGRDPFPVLLTTRDALPDVTRDEILRIGMNAGWGSDLLTVFVVGGPSVVSDAQVEALKKLQYVGDVVRIAGPNRFATAAEVASMTITMRPTSVGRTVSPALVLGGTVFIVNGYSFADALSAGACAAASHAPVLLTRRDALPAETAAWLRDHPASTAVIVGSPSVVSAGIESALATAPYNIGRVVRVGGSTRYETSLLLAQFGADQFEMRSGSMVLVTGVIAPDGLAATAMASRMNAPVLLTPPATLAPQVTDYYRTYGPMRSTSYVLGSSAAISDGVLGTFRDLYKLPIVR